MTATSLKKPDNGLFVVEWSKSQSALHIQPLSKALHEARMRFAEDVDAPNDFQIVHVGDEASAYSVADQLRPILEKRETAQRNRSEEVGCTIQKPPRAARIAPTALRDQPFKREVETLKRKMEAGQASEDEKERMRWLVGQISGQQHSLRM